MNTFTTNMEDEWEVVMCKNCGENEASIDSRLLTEVDDPTYLMCEECEQKYKSMYKCQLPSCTSSTNGSQYCSKSCMFEHCDLLNES